MKKYMLQVYYECVRMNVHMYVHALYIVHNVVGLSLSYLTTCVLILSLRIL